MQPFLLLKTILLGLFLCINLILSAQQTYIIQKGENTQYPAFKVEYFEDKEGTFDFKNIKDQSFQESEMKFLNFGYSSSIFWVRMRLKNETSHNDWRLLSSLTYHSYLDFWIEDGKGNWNHIKTGRNYPFSSRQSYEHVGFTFPLDIPENQERIVYLRLQSPNPLSFPLEIIRAETLNRRFQVENLYYGIYFGILLVMIFYNFFIYISLRNNAYLYYILSIICTLIIFSASTGYLFRYVYPNWMTVNNYSTRLFMGIAAIVLTLFAVKFLEIKKSTWLYRVFILNIVLAVIAIVLTMTDVWPGSTNTFISLFTPFLIIAGAIVWYRGNSSAKYYVFAWISYLTGGLLISMRNSGRLPITVLTSHAVEIGSVLEVVLLSLALADRYRRLKKEKELATKKVLEVQKKANEELEDKVTERTLTLKERNEELNQINEELDSTLYTVQIQKEEIELQNKQILDSINYAERIQQAILPSHKDLNQCFSDIFVLNRPRDVISGDFYYFSKKENRVILVLADCTGHGVPGAMMSMMGVNLMERIFSENENIKPNEALEKMDYYLAKTFSNQEKQVRDGMDVSICILDKEQKKLWFSGAKQSLFRTQKGAITVYKKSVQAVGGFHRMDLDKIPLHEINYNPEDRFFMFSDGYPDQFGGENGKKFMIKKFRESILETANLPLTQQKEILSLQIEEWMKRGNELQTDDILVIGFEP